MKRFVIAAVLVSFLIACGRNESPVAGDGHGHGEAPATEFERGPHRGRMLRDGDFALEVTIFETGVPPQFRLYAYRGDKLLPPGEVAPTIQLCKKR